MGNTNRQSTRQDCRSFINTLSPERKIHIRFCKNKGRITYFSIQYLLLYTGEWRRIIRVDTQHGVAHRHVFHYKKKKKHNRREYLGEVEQYNEVYTEWYNKVAKNYKKLEENYLN